jgi:hypothetical protein
LSGHQQSLANLLRIKRQGLFEKIFQFGKKRISGIEGIKAGLTGKTAGDNAPALQLFQLPPDKIGINFKKPGDFVGIALPPGQQKKQDSLAVW